MRELPIDPIDCRPIVDPPDVRLSVSDLQRIEPVRRTLLSPLHHGGIDGWRAAVNRSLIDAFDSDSAMFQLDLAGHQLCYSDEFDMELLATYGREIMPDFHRKVGLYRNMTEVRAGNRSMAWGRELGWLYESDYFNELVRTHRSFDPIWCVAPVEGARYPAVIHTYHAQLSQDRFFGPREIRLMELLQPALEAGVQTTVRTVANRGTLTRSLDAQPHGAMVYDVDGRVLHRNAALARIARTRQGERTLLEAGRQLAAAVLEGSPAPADSTRRVGRRGVAGLIQTPAGSAARTVQIPGGRPRLHAVRIGAGMFDLRPVALVTVAADHRPLPDRKTVADRFGLTPRQSEVALLLADRRTNPEIAELLGISEHTVGSHVEAVMRTLGVHDRREIRRLLQVAGD